MALPDLSEALRELDAQQARRRLRPLENWGPVSRLHGRDLVNFSSNDYLDLSREPEVIDGARRALEQYGAGAASSRLITGHNPLTEALEKEIAAWKGCEAALVFSSGYLANLALMTAFAGPSVPVFTDRLSHASLIDGMLLARAPWSRFHHNDTAHLASLLRDRKTPCALVATESVFSMEGDLAPLSAMAQLCSDEGVWFLVDEAHATGVFGEQGEGRTPGLPGATSSRLVMGTFGKALGNVGAYVCGTKEQCEFLVNKARPFIFTTALPPSVIGGTLAAVRFLRAHPGLGKQLLERAATFRGLLSRDAVPLIPSESQIFCVACGANERALALAGHLEAKGLLGVAIRPPTVEPGKARVRLSLTRGHRDTHLDQLRAALLSFDFQA